MAHFHKHTNHTYHKEWKYYEYTSQINLVLFFILLYFHFFFHFFVVVFSLLFPFFNKLEKLQQLFIVIIIYEQHIEIFARAFDKRNINNNEKNVV